MGAFKKFMDDWKNSAPGSGSKGPSGGNPQLGGDIGRMNSEPDPWPGLVRAMSHGEMLHRLVIGSHGADGNLITTEARRNLLILGPPRSDKTVGVLCPAILAHPGPVVSTSTKEDVFRATAMVRSRLGRIWHYNPDGGDILPGCIPLRWSPIPAAKDWSMAVMLGRSMADVAEMGSSSGESEYFRNRAGVLIAALLHAAGLAEKPMMWMLKAVANDRRTVDEAYKILSESLSPEAQIAANDLQGIRDLDPRSQGPIFSTTATAFAAYRLPGALASTNDPNFKPDDFAAGNPNAFNPDRFDALGGPADEPAMLRGIRWEQSTGVYDTIYLTASSSRQSIVAPLVAGLLAQLREATFALHRQDEARDDFWRPAMLWALDEVAGIAPLRDLPETLSQSGGQGLLVAACLQDLQMARVKWDKAADGFLTLFGNVVVFPGLRDESTLRAISAVAGKRWVDVASQGETMNNGRGPGGRNSTEGTTQQVTQQQIDALDLGAVARGLVHLHPNYVLTLGPKGWGWIFSTPYYCVPPWPHLLVATMEYFDRFRSPFERAAKLPIPVLNQDGSFAALRAAGGEALVQRYQAAAAALKGRAEAARSVAEKISHGGLVAGWDDTRPVRQMAATRSFIAVAGPDTATAVAQVLDRPQVTEFGNGRFEARPGTADDQVAIPLSMKDTLNIPHADQPEPFATPDWVITFNGQVIALLNVVKGGVNAKVEARNDLISAHHGEVPGTALLVEAWEFDRIGHHIVGNLAAELGRFAPACWLSAEGLTFSGSPWPTSVPSAA